MLENDIKNGPYRHPLEELMDIVLKKEGLKTKIGETVYIPNRHKHRQPDITLVDGPVDYNPVPSYVERVIYGPVGQPVMDIEIKEQMRPYLGYDRSKVDIYQQYDSFIQQEVSLNAIISMKESAGESSTEERIKRLEVSRKAEFLRAIIQQEELTSVGRPTLIVTWRMVKWFWYHGFRKVS